MFVGVLSVCVLYGVSLDDIKRLDVFITTIAKLSFLFVYDINGYNIDVD